MQRQHVKHVEDFQIQGVAFAEEDYLKTAQSTAPQLKNYAQS